MATPRGCILRKSAGQQLTQNTWTTLTWETEERDTDAFHAPGDNTKITIPNLGSKMVVELRAGIRFDANTLGDIRGVRIAKNGSFPYPGAGAQEVTNTTGHTITVNCSTVPLFVVPGDYFTCEGYIHDATSATTGTDTTSPRTFFEIAVRAIKP
jgi:hypothetical protein